MQNLRYFVELCVITVLCSYLFFFGLSKMPALTNQGTAATESSSSTAKVTRHASFHPRHHGHYKVPNSVHHSLLPARRPHQSLVPAKDPKEPMAKDYHHRFHPDSMRGNNTKNSNTILSPVLDQHGVSKHAQQKVWKDAMVGGGEGRHGRYHKKKRMEDSGDYYYTYEQDYEVKVETASSKIVSFFKDTIGWVMGTETRDDYSLPEYEVYLRGSTSNNYKY